MPGSYSSASDRVKAEPLEPPSLSPPVTRTSPPGSRVAVCCSRPACIEPVFAQVPLPGLYSSELAVSLQKSSSQVVNPPVTSTRPVRSSVAVCSIRPMCMLPVFAQVPVAGSYSSALAWLARKLPASQP